MSTKASNQPDGSPCRVLIYRRQAHQHEIDIIFQVTLMNVLGMSAAIGGVGMYNMVKYHEKLAKETLPTQNNNKTTSLWANGNLGRQSMPL